MSAGRIFSIALAWAGWLWLVTGAQAYELEGESWPAGTQISLNLQLGAPKTTLLDGSTTWNQVAEAAKDVWNPYLGNGVAFASNYDAVTPAQSDGRNTVFFSATIFGESFGTDALAVTLLEYNGSVTHEADVIVNNAVQFNSYRGSQRDGSTGAPLYDLRRVLIHEFGHVLGLAHADSSTAIMYATITNLDTVQSDDIAGVTAIYGAPLRQPTITGGASVFAPANEFFQYQVAATGGKLTYTATGLPAGLQINASSGAITGTPTVPGTSTVRITVSNSVGAASGTLTITVGAAPVITSPAYVNALVGLPFYYQITATNDPTSYGPFTTYGSGLTYDQTRGLISGTPTAATLYGPITAISPAGTGSLNLTINIGTDLAATILDGSNVDNLYAAGNSLVLAADGNFYTGGAGVIIKMTPQGVISVFCPIPASGGTQYAYAALVQGADGNFYGTTSSGGANGLGTFFEVTPAGVLTTLYPFGADDGGVSKSTLIQGSDGHFYGALGDDSIGKLGTLIQLTPAGVLTVLHRFDGVTDGQEPSGLILASDGNFYGTTRAGGPGNGGTIFEMTPAGALTTIQAFSTGGVAYPAGALVKGPDGNLYGTTFSGYVYETQTYPSDSTFFRVTPGGGYAAIRTMTASSYPLALTPGPDGYFYGVGATNYSNGQFANTISRYALDGTATEVHRFSFGESAPECAPTFGADGNLYCVTDNRYVERITPPVGSGATTYVSVETTVANAVASNSQHAVFKLTRSNGDTSSALKVNLTYDGAARAGTDYTALPGTLTIPAGASSVTGSVTAINQSLGQTPRGLNVHAAAGSGYTLNPNSEVTTLQIYGSPAVAHPAFFQGEAALAGGAYYLAFASGNPFGYYSYLSDPHYFYHFDLGFEYWFDAADGESGVYLYDFLSKTFFYTSPTFPFPYLYDFTLKTVLYYFPDPTQAGRYNTNGKRYFYDFATGKIISK